MFNQPATDQSSFRRNGRGSFRVCGALLFMLAALANSLVMAQTPSQLDTTFGGGTGSVTTAVSPGAGSDVPVSVKWQPDGKIVVAGICEQSFCVVRYEADGTVDVSFGVNGRVFAALGTLNRARAMALQPDGKIVVVGDCTFGVQTRFCAMRMSTQGVVDSAFGVSGWVNFIFNGTDNRANGVALQPDGKIVIVGVCSVITVVNPTGDDFCVARLGTDGVLDTSFNGSGKVVTTSAGNSAEAAYAVAIQPDGKIVVAGSCDYSVSNTPLTCVMRYLANGSALDTTFGGGQDAPGSGRYRSSCMFTCHIPSVANHVAIQPDGKILFAGTCNGVPCAGRILANGSNSDGYGTQVPGKADGIVKLDGVTVQATTDAAFAVAPDGSVVLGGFCNPTGGIYYSCLGRLLTTGAFDSSFVAGNYVTTATATFSGWASAALQPNGRIIVVRTKTNAGSGVDFSVSRFVGSPAAATQCGLDFDGDGQVLATTDALIHTRIALGIQGAEVLSGIALPSYAARRTWAEIRGFLVNQCGMTLP